MKLFQLLLNPESSFGTPLKGDTLFGHLCWQLAYDSSLALASLEHLLAEYPERPFAIVSSAFLCHATEDSISVLLPRPQLPLSVFFSEKELSESGKDCKRRSWLLLGKDFCIDVASCKLCKPNSPFRSPELNQLSHNSINRISLTTGSGAFAPFAETQICYAPGTQLTVYVLLDTSQMPLEGLLKAFNSIGKTGFGSNASIGRGRFSCSVHSELELPDLAKAEAGYAMAPVLPKENSVTSCFTNPFVRFGRHGDILARTKNPFKAPVVLADEGAVFIRGECDWNRPYLGSAIVGVSASEPATVQQGYAPMLPLTLGERASELKSVLCQ